MVGIDDAQVCVRIAFIQYPVSSALLQRNFFTRSQQLFLPQLAVALSRARHLNNNLAFFNIDKFVRVTVEMHVGFATRSQAHFCKANAEAGVLSLDPLHHAPRIGFYGHRNTPFV